MNTMKTSTDGVVFLKGHEACVLHVYDDKDPKAKTREILPGMSYEGTLTAGWGHTGPDVIPGMTVTQHMADVWLVQDLAKSEKRVNEMVIAPGLRQHQFDVLVSWVYNTGGPKTSQMWNLVNRWLSNEIDDEQLGAWWTSTYVTSGGQPMSGLVKRRKEEYDIFVNGYNRHILKKNSQSF